MISSDRSSFCGKERGPKSTRKGDQSGFTLVEVLVVLAIAALLAVVIIPALRTPSRTLLETSAWQVAAVMRLARATAQATNNEALVIFDLEARQVQFLAAEPYILPQDIEVQFVSARPERRGKSIAGVRFYPDGTSSGGEITLIHAQRQSRILVNWLTGNTEIQSFLDRAP